MIALIALLAVVSTAQTPDDAWVQRIYQLYRQGQYGDSERELTQFLEKHPESWRVPELLYLQLSHLRPEQPDAAPKAIGLLRRLHQEHPQSPEAWSSSQLLTQWTGWNWMPFPTQLDTTQVREYRVTVLPPKEKRWAPQPRPRLEIFRIPGEALRGVLRRSYAGMAGEEVPRSQWIRVQGPHVLLEPAIKWEHEAPGRYRVEEELDAFRNVSYVTVTNFVMIMKYSLGKLLVFTVDPESGDAAPDIEVEAGGDDFNVRGKTGKNGLAILECPRPRGVMAWKGDDLVEMGLSDEEEADPLRSMVCLTTDRPIYRPGQTVYYKAIQRDFLTEGPQLPKARKVRVEVLDSGGRCVQKQDLDWSPVGTLSGSFRLGDSPALGDYSVRIDVRRSDVAYFDTDNPGLWTRSFQVAAYRKPDLAVSIEFPEGVLAGSSSFKARIRATAFHGGPAAHADVSWSAGPRYSNQKLQPRLFEDPLAWFVPESESARGGWDAFVLTDQVVEGSGKTGADGTLDIVVSMDSHPNFERWVVQATVRDLTRMEAHGSAAIDVQPGALRLSVGPRRLFYASGEDFDGFVRVTTADGKPVADRSVELSGLIQRKVADKEWEYESVYRGTATSDATGLAVFKVRSSEAGVLRLKAVAKDRNGRATIGRMELQIAGDEPDCEDGVAVMADKGIYQEGETARLLIRARHPGAMALLTVESADLHEVRVLRLDKANQIVELPLRALHTPNVVVHLAAWKNGDWMGGGTELLVVPAQRILEVGVKANRDTYGPRERAMLKLSTSLAGRGVSSEVELAIVDEAIFALKEAPELDLRTFFVPLKPEAVGSWSNSNWRHDWDTPARNRYQGPLVGATFSLDEAKESDELSAGFAAAETRRWFPDTLKWIAAVQTDEQGQASVEVEMPDSLTSWRIVARAVSGRDAFGQARSSILTRKNVILRLSAPRFYVAGDEGVVSAVLRNQLPEAQEFTLSLRATGADVKAAPSILKVAAGAEARLDWTLKVSKPGSVVLKAEALGKVESDAIELEIPVRTHGEEQSVTASGVVRGTWQADLALPDHAQPGSPRLQLRVSGPGSDAILEALPSLVGYPYGCVEQTMSRFLPAVVAGRALARLNIAVPALQAKLPGLVDQGLQRLYGFQHDDGGWGWWKHDETDTRMTAYVVYGLSVARDAGYPVDEKCLKAGVARLLERDPSCFGNYALKLAGAEPREEARPMMDEDVSWQVLSGHREALANLNSELPARATEDAVRRVSMAIRARLSVDRKDPQIPPLVEWLLSKRRGGAWVSTLDSACAVFALTELLQGEAQRIEARARVNGKAIAIEDGRAFVDAALLKPGPNRVEVESTGQAFASALLSFISDEEMPAPSGDDLILSRSFERLIAGGDEQRWEVLESGSVVRPGEELRMTLTVRSKKGAEYVMIESPIAAGSESRETDANDWRNWYARQEHWDDRVCVAASHVGVAVNEYRCRLRPTLPGRYHILPARAWPMYDPDVRATSGEFILRVRDQ